MEESDFGSFTNHGFLATHLAAELSHRPQGSLTADKAALMARKLRLYTQHWNFIRYPGGKALSAEETQEVKPLTDFFSRRIEQIKLCGESQDFNILIDELNGYADYLEGKRQLDNFGLQELTKLCKDMSNWCLGRLNAKPDPPEL